MKTTRTAAQSTILVAIASRVGLTACTTYIDRRPPPPLVYSEPAPASPPPPHPVHVEPPSVEGDLASRRRLYRLVSAASLGAHCAVRHHRDRHPCDSPAGLRVCRGTPFSRADPPHNGREQHHDY